jgi:SAM-dependent methyltransferase
VYRFEAWQPARVVGTLARDATEEDQMTTQTTYALPNRSRGARRRLELLEAAYDPSSVRVANELGVGLGWRCLDVGAGGGSFSRWLASQVGETGSVVAADLDPTVLREIDAPGVTIRQLDVREDDLPEGEYDLVHTRLVLLHLPERDEILTRLARSLRPGGVLMVEEDDIYPVVATAEGDYRAAWRVFRATMESVGVDAEWARSLPERLGELGLVDVDAEVTAQLFRGGSNTAQFWSLTWLQVRDRTVELGLPVETIDAGRSVLADPAHWFHGPANVTAWGRRPAHSPHTSQPGSIQRHR